MIDYILGNADKRYVAFEGQRLFNKALCKKCNNTKCTSDCGTCLYYMHRPEEAKKKGIPDRKYDCPNMADYYVCKYACRFTSEMIYALRRLVDIRDKNIKVLSFGCGPCTDLFAIDYLQRQAILKSVDYRGIDYEANMWEDIHHDIKETITQEQKVTFYYHDICSIIDDIVSGVDIWNNWIPDVVIFQYLFSDMHKHSGENKTMSFIEKFAKFANDYMAENTYIVINDINLSKKKPYHGGREYFDVLYRSLDDFSYRSGRFHNNNSELTYPYGRFEFPNNKTFFHDLIDQMAYFSPFDSCASAQLIAKKDKVRK